LAIELSVGVPLFRAKYIGWLCFEGLLRQRKIDFEWEIVVIEEENQECMGREVGGYSKPLRKVGCVRISYSPLKKWIPLAKKYRLMTDMCSPSSRIIAHNSADDLNGPLWLHEVHKVFKDPKVDWFKQSKSIHYNIKTGDTVLFDITDMPQRTDCIGRAIRLDLLRELPESKKRKNCDKWLFQAINEKREIRFHIDKSNNWKHGLSTWGLNNISSTSADRFKSGDPPWYECPINIKKTIPPVILKRLVESAKYVKLHDRGLPWKVKKIVKKKIVKKKIVKKPVHVHLSGKRSDRGGGNGKDKG